jgi:hypothetical protein
MSDAWVHEPRKAPYRCRRTGHDSASAGPYFEESLGYSEGPGDDRELTLYHSAEWIKSMCDSPGSPLHVTTAAEHEATQQHIEHLKGELEAANNRVDELEAEVDLLSERVGNPIDEEALITNLVVRLDERFAKKAGRKPSGDRAA